MIYYTKYVETTVDVEESWGNVNVQIDTYPIGIDYEMEIDADEFVDQLCDEEKDELRTALGVTNEVVSVKELYDTLDAGQKAYLFNKILKEQDYNPNGTSIVKLQSAMQSCITAQDKEEV